MLAPTIRTILDAQLSFGLGTAFSLTRIMNAPGDPGSYVPGFYLDASAAPLMGSLFAY